MPTLPKAGVRGKVVRRGYVGRCVSWSRLIVQVQGARRLREKVLRGSVPRFTSQWVHEVTHTRTCATARARPTISKTKMTPQVMSRNLVHREYLGFFGVPSSSVSGSSSSPSCDVWRTEQ